jgi:hypothetical protein
VVKPTLFSQLPPRKVTIAQAGKWVAVCDREHFGSVENQYAKGAS